MHEKVFYASLTRISDLHSEPYEIRPLARDRWATGDYLVGEMLARPGSLSSLELRSGRMIEVLPGDLVVGALGARRATLEAVGDWRAVGDDLVLHALTSAGLMGRTTSRSALLRPMMALAYRGHAMRGGRKVAMRDFVPPTPSTRYACPMVLLIGTSMSCGKTTAGRVIVHELSRSGVKVVAAKLTGAGRLRDTLVMGDAGAAATLDFVDVGLPSSVCPPDEFRPALEKLLALIAAEQPDVVVAEAGASPLEPYNGGIVLELLREHLRCTVLCASDPYAVVGVMKGFGFPADLVTGVATSTSAGIDLIEKLGDVKALNVLDPAALPELDALLSDRLGVAVHPR